MKIKRENPPNYEEIIKHFPVEENKNVVFTYGDTLYAPNLKENEIISDHLKAHESTHTAQQGDKPDNWWDKYIADVDFRLSQEVEAYHNQYMFIKSRYGTNTANKMVVQLASDLISEIYQFDLTYNTAEKMIKKWCKKRRDKKLENT